MRKQLYITILAGVAIGITLALIVMAVSKTASSPETALLQPVKTNQATMADQSIVSAQGVIETFPKDSKGYNMLAAAMPYDGYQFPRGSGGRECAADTTSPCPSPSPTPRP